MMFTAAAFFLATAGEGGGPAGVLLYGLLIGGGVLFIAAGLLVLALQNRQQRREASRLELERDDWQNGMAGAEHHLGRLQPGQSSLPVQQPYPVDAGHGAMEPGAAEIQDPASLLLPGASRQQAPEHAGGGQALWGQQAPQSSALWAEQERRERQAREQAERLARDRAQQQLEIEEREARLAAEQAAWEAAERRAREEVERRAREEAAARARQEEERRAREEAEREARRAAEQAAREEAERRARAQVEEERRVREEAAARAQQERERRAREAAVRVAREEQERRARAEAERRRQGQPGGGQRPGPARPRAGQPAGVPVPQGPAGQPGTKPVADGAASSMRVGVRPSHIVGAPVAAEVKRLLLVEDSVTMTRVFKMVFRGEGFEVIAVPRGELALERAVEERPDIVVTDLSLDGRDGYEVCRQLKADPRTAAVPIVLLHGSNAVFDEARAEAVGAAAAIAKPFETQDLIDIVRGLAR